MIRFHLFLIALVASGALQIANGSGVVLPTCQYSAISDGSLFDIDLTSLSTVRSCDVKDKDGHCAGAFAGVEYFFTLHTNPYDPDSCQTPGCCDGSAIFEYVSIDLLKECGPPSLNFVEEVRLDKVPLAPSEYTISQSNSGGTRITAKLPPTAPGSQPNFILKLSNVSSCVKDPSIKKSYPCPSDGCHASIITKKPSSLNCCKTETFSNNDVNIPKSAKLPANTGKDVSSYPLNLLVLGDWGCPPSSSSYKRVEFMAKGMAVVARKYGVQAVLNTGDNFYESGLILNRSSPATSLDKTVWEKLFMVHPELNVPWHGVLGNHDYSYALNDGSKYKACIATTKEQYETQQCVASALLQHEGVGIIKNPHWKVRNGTWTVKDLGGHAGLVDLILFDGNAFNPSSILANVYGGIQEQDGKKVTEDLSTQMRESNATWRLVMSHYPLLSYGSRCVGDLENPSVPWRGFDTTISNGKERLTGCGRMKHIREMVFNENIPLYMNGHDHMAELLKNASTYMLVSGNGYKQSTVKSMNNADTKWLIYGHAAPRKDETGKVTDWYPSDVGFNSIHIKDDAMVIKFWGIGSKQPPNVPALQLSLHYEIKLNRKDFPYPNKKSPAPKPAVAPSPLPQPASSPSPSASPPLPQPQPQPASPPSPGASPPSPAVPVSPPPQPSPVLSNPSPAPSPAAVPPSG